MDIKKDFFNYIGSENSLAKYSRSYKLIFLKSLLELESSSGKAKVIDVARKFKQFYEDRKEKGLEPDSDVESTIQNIEKSTITQVIGVIRDNPYDSFHKQNYIDIELINGEEYYCFNSELYKEITQNDKENLLELLYKKIRYYFSTRVDNRAGETNKMNILKGHFEQVLNNYYEARTSQQFANNPMGALIRNEITGQITVYDFIDNSIYKVNGSVGQGNWAIVPWVAILDKRITTTTQKGVYIAYIFSSDMKRLYLTLLNGATELNKQYGKKETIAKMHEIAENIHSKIETDIFKADNNIETGSEFYEEGCIFYKEYQAGQMPEDEILVDDLKAMVEIYQKYYTIFESKDSKEIEPEKPKDPEIEKEEDETMSVKENISRISAYIKSKGFTYEDDLIKNFYLSLKSKPFVILAGTSGTGKSKLVKLFSEAVGANSKNGRYKLVPVKPDWSDATDLLGYRDLHGEFHPGVLTSFINKAIDDIENPYFICLDEMNLARVEYYFSDILSVMETRTWDGERIITDKLISVELFGDDEEAKSIYQNIYIPENLYIIGTVNMDETTFPFSKKVLDRANTIEFSYVDFDYNFNKNLEVDPIELNNEFFKGQFLRLDNCGKYEEIVNRVIVILKSINEKLMNSNLHFGYRIRDEICYYTIYSQENDLSSFHNALDNEILQKILPRIQGSSTPIKRAIIDLFKICINNQVENFNHENSGVNEDMFKYIEDNPKIPYIKSASKLAFMMRRFEEDGFTSYWL